MDSTFPLTFLPFLGLAFFLVILVVTLWAFAIPAVLYFLSAVPNRVLSTVLSYKIRGGGIILLLVGFGLFLNDLLSQIGFRSESVFEWPLDSLRAQIILLILGTYLMVLSQKFLPISIFNTENNEKKSPVLYASHVFHIVSTGILIVVELMLLGYLADWLLQFGLIGANETQEAGLSFFVNFVSVLLPTILVGLFLLPSFQKKERFFPQIKSESLAIFLLIFLFVAGGIALVTLGVLFREWLVVIFDRPEILGDVMKVSEVRSLLVTFVLALVTTFRVWKKCGGMKAFQKK